MNKKELEIFGMAKIVMDTYKTKFDKAKKRKEDRFKSLNANYKAGSPLFVKERDRITPEFQEEVEKVRNDLMAEFEDALVQLRAVETAKVATISNETKTMMGILDCLENKTMSVDEYEVLVQHYGNKSYWIDRFFERIANKCGIMDSMVQPPLSTKLEILQTLEQNVREYIDKYDGENKCFPVTSSDKYVYALEREYTNDYSGVRMNDTETAKRLVNKAFSIGDSLERSCTLANMLRTSKPDLQHEILCLLAEHDYPALSDPTMNFIGVKNIVDKFKKEDLQDIKAADAAMVKVKSAKSHQERIATIYNNLDNRHFVKAIEKHIADTNDKELRESYKNMQQVKREQENETIKGK